MTDHSQLKSDIDDLLASVDEALLANSKVTVKRNVDELIWSATDAPHYRDRSYRGMAFHQRTVMYCKLAGHMRECNCLVEEVCPCMRCCPCSHVDENDPWDNVQRDDMDVRLNAYGGCYNTVNNIDALFYVRDVYGPDHLVRLVHFGEITVNEALFTLIYQAWEMWVYQMIEEKRRREWEQQLQARADEGAASTLSWVLGLFGPDAHDEPADNDGSDCSACDPVPEEGF